VRSTVLTASFAASVADFWLRDEVENEARGAKRKVRSVVVDVRVRNDMIISEWKTTVAEVLIGGKVRSKWIAGTF
jgi:hypothetical protein